MQEAMTTLTGKPRIKRTMWSRRAQEYEAKINSGDLVSIAEVVRDLHRADDQPEQSYSERQIFETAIIRHARELEAMENIDEPAAQDEIVKVVKAACGGLPSGECRDGPETRSEEHKTEHKTIKSHADDNIFGK